jgi:hypothetical protein
MLAPLRRLANVAYCQLTPRSLSPLVDGERLLDDSPPNLGLGAADAALALTPSPLQRPETSPSPAPTSPPATTTSFPPVSGSSETTPVRRPAGSPPPSLLPATTHLSGRAQVEAPPPYDSDDSTTVIDGGPILSQEDGPSNEDQDRQTKETNMTLGNKGCNTVTTVQQGRLLGMNYAVESCIDRDGKAVAAQTTRLGRTARTGVAYRADLNQVRPRLGAKKSRKCLGLGGNPRLTDHEMMPERPLNGGHEIKEVCSERLHRAQYLKRLRYRRFPWGMKLKKSKRLVR